MRFLLVFVLALLTACSTVDTSVMPTQRVSIPEQVLVERTYVVPEADELSEEQTLAYILALYRLIDRLNDDKSILIEYLQGLNTGESND